MEVLGPNSAGARGDFGFLFVVFVFLLGVTHFGFALTHDITHQGLVRSVLLSQEDCIGKRMANLNVTFSGLMTLLRCERSISII